MADDEDTLEVEVRATGALVAMVVDLLLADRACAVEFSPIIDLFKIFRLVSMVVSSFACKKKTNVKHQSSNTHGKCIVESNMFDYYKTQYYV